MTLAPIDNNEEEAETDLVIMPTETPDDVLKTAKQRAKALVGILQYGKHYIEKNGNKYLKVEAWQTFLAFDNVRAETQWVKPIRDDDGTIVAYQAEVALLDKRNGTPRGRAIMSCGLDEYVCQGKVGYAKTIAAESMAQTRAESKACRQNYAFVAVLAGYKPTPAEEMMLDEEDEEPQTKRFAPPQQRAQPSRPATPTNNDHPRDCEEHQEGFTRRERGNYVWYSHKIGDAWCNCACSDCKDAAAAMQSKRK